MNLNLRYLILGLLMLPLLTQAQVVINEYSASNLNQFIDNNDKFEDWIELYNTSSSSVDIGGWFLSDKIDNPLKWVIPTGTTIDGNGFLTVWCSGRDGLVMNELHTSFKLTQTKDNESVVLSNPSGNVVSSSPVELTLLGHSRSLDTDGGSNWMVCTDPSFGISNDGSPMNLTYTAAPTIDLEAGFYFGTQTVTIQNNEPNSTLHYTIDGHLPTPSSPVYSGPITIESTTVVKAIAYSNDAAILPGKIDFSTYFIDESFTLPVFSVASDEVQNLANGNGELIPVGSLEYFDITDERTAVGYGDLNRHGQDSWILDHRSIDWVTRDEMGYTSTVKDELFTYSERDEHQRIMFRASGDDNYPANDDADHVGSCHIRDEYVHTLALNGNMKLDVRAVERVIVFLNGDYWGVYGMRERPVDHDYTKYYYDQDKYNLQYISTWGNSQAEYGGDDAFADWGVFRDFVLDNDMGIEENYEYVKDNFQVKSLIDYMLMNLNSVSSDWLNYNTGWWRGVDPDGDHKKWGYILWDNDASFDYYINYSGVPDISPYAEPCDIDDISDYMDQFFGGPWNSEDIGKHEKIFLKLQDENDEFRQLYYSRSADMMNTVFSCDNMLNTLDSMVAIIAPEMPRQIARWGGTMEEWEGNVAYLRSFVETRCTQLDEGLVSCFDLDGPYSLTLKIEPAGVGEIEINTINDIENFPWTGDYFGNMINLIEANSKNDNFDFLEWESTSGNLIDDLFDDNTHITLTQDDTLIARFSTSVSVENIDDVLSMSVYPTLVTDVINLDFSLMEKTDLTFELYSLLGEKIVTFNELNNTYSQGEYREEIQVSDLNLSSGMYLLNVRTGNATKAFKISVME